MRRRCSSYFICHLVVSTPFLSLILFVYSGCFQQQRQDTTSRHYSYNQQRASSSSESVRTIVLLRSVPNNNHDNDNNHQDGDDDIGYKFGDITRGLIRKVTSSTEDGSSSIPNRGYKFGDLTKGLINTTTSRINVITGKNTYEFGDLSRYADAQVKAQIANFTGKQQEDYAVGDISKEIIRRVSSGEYSTQDVVLLCRALLTFGVGLTPVAKFLPAKLLLEMISFGLAQEVSERLVSALVQTLDKRFKETITGDPNYQLGDKTKRVIQSMIAMANEKVTSGGGDASNKRSEVISDDAIDPSLLAELEDWDRRLGIVGNETNAA